MRALILSGLWSARRVMSSLGSEEIAWLVTLGNVAGGVVIVGLLNYGQVRAGKD